MRKSFIAASALLVAATPAFAQTDHAISITDAQAQEILKLGTATIDHAIRVVDMGGYQLSVGVTHRSPAGPQSGAALANAANPKPCGLESAPSGAKLGPLAMITHSDTDEVYVITSGAGTLLTGGKILNGKQWPDDSDVVKLNYGPSCTGQVVGDFVGQKVVAGDVTIVPAGVPHGWTALSPDVTYFSIRIDPKKVLEHGYVNPAIK